MAWRLEVVDDESNEKFLGPVVHSKRNITRVWVTWKMLLRKEIWKEVGM